MHSHTNTRRRIKSSHMLLAIETDLPTCHAYQLGPFCHVAPMNLPSQIPTCLL